MKPSNTGIDWLRLTTIPSRVADAISGNITEREFVTVCEWAAQIAIAKYRAELAAKLGASIKHEDVDDLDDSHNAALEWVLSLLNENDDEAQI